MANRVTDRVGSALAATLTLTAFALAAMWMATHPIFTDIPQLVGLDKLRDMIVANQIAAMIFFGIVVFLLFLFVFDVDDRVAAAIKRR